MEQDGKTKSADKGTEVEKIADGVLLILLDKLNGIQEVTPELVTFVKRMWRRVAWYSSPVSKKI